MSKKIGKIGFDEIENIIKPNLGVKDPAVIHGPEPGLDAGVIRLDQHGKYLVVSVDPITATSELIGSWVVYITANDVLSAGGLPRWFLLTLLLPIGISTKVLKNIMEDVSKSLNKIGSSLVSGHTEWTPGIENPIAIGSCIGIADKALDISSVSPGDKVYLAGEIGLEGSYILWISNKEQLKNLLTNTDIIHLNKIPEALSIYPYVKKVLGCCRDCLKWMHDPTEGGFFNGVYELSKAIGYKIKLYGLPKVSDVVVKISKYFRLNPYRLLSSGSVLMIIKKECVHKLTKMLSFEISMVGEVTDEKGLGVYVDDNLLEIKSPEKDEIWKVIK